jgi:RNA polymerase sigma factor for flagellar operon FliA
MDWAARSVRSRARQVEAVRHQLTAALHRIPRSSEVAEAMGLSEAEMSTLDADVARAQVLRLDGFAPDTGPAAVPDTAVGPEAMLLQREQLGYLHDAVALLPERMRFVVVAYFFEQRHLAEIGAELGVSESRVSQLRADALVLLRDGLNSQLDPQPSTSAGRSTRAHQDYCQALTESGTVASRLAKTNVRGEVQCRVAAPRAAA